MTILELKQLINNFDDDLDVVVFSNECECFFSLTGIDCCNMSKHTSYPGILDSYYQDFKGATVVVLT